MPSIRNVMSIKLIALTTPIQFLPLPMKFLTRCSIMLLTLYSLNNFAQQHHYEFNRPGSECNFEYIMYSALQDEMAYRRPFIFVLCKLNESIDKTFEEDTLRNLPQFYNYNFVYVPNKGGAIQSKLYCFPSLVSLLTRSFKSRNKRCQRRDDRDHGCAH